ncbi:hypothetical protein GCM10018954_033330 [Kutzneria kofuensis]
MLDDHPLRESTRALLITALHREGRKGEAKSVYQAGARLLDERLGVQPGPALRRVYETLIDTTSAAEVLPRVVPSQLPHDTPGSPGAARSCAAWTRCCPRPGPSTAAARSSSRPSRAPPESARPRWPCIGRIWFATCFRTARSI